MSKRKYKQLTDEQRARKNERERERKARLKAQAAQPPEEQPPEVSVASVTYANGTESEEPLTAFDVYQRRMKREAQM